MFKKPKTQTNSLGLQQAPQSTNPHHQRRNTSTHYESITQNQWNAFLHLSAFSHAIFRKLSCLLRSLAEYLIQACSNHVQRSNHPNRSTHCCRIPSIQGSSLHCESGDPKHQPGDLDQRNRGFRKLPCLRQLNSLKRAFPVVIVIWSRQTLTTTRRAPKPYYRIELQKKLSLTEPSKQASILVFAINKLFI